MAVCIVLEKAMVVLHIPEIEPSFSRVPHNEFCRLDNHLRHCHGLFGFSL